MRLSRLRTKLSFHTRRIEAASRGGWILNFPRQRQSSQPQQANILDVQSFQFRLQHSGQLGGCL
jgi:hypothetical protein